MILDIAVDDFVIRTHRNSTGAEYEATGNYSLIVYTWQRHWCILGKDWSFGRHFSESRGAYKGSSSDWCRMKARTVAMVVCFFEINGEWPR